MEFIYAKATQSRLMGSIGLHIVFTEDKDRFNQFFLLDSEGLGISDYVGLKNASNQEIEIEEERLMGGLGSKKLILSKEEAYSLLYQYGSMNIRYGKPLPEPFSEYAYGLKKDLNLDHEELFLKLCKEFESEIEFVNYIVMRMIARDRESLRIFSLNEDLKDFHVTNINGTLLKSEIIKNNNGMYTCQAYFEDSDGYYKIKIGISIEGYRLKSMMVIDKEQISPEEVQVQLMKKEYVANYKIKEESFEVEFSKRNPYLFKIPFEKGNIYTHFYEDNSHVGLKTYLISNDMKRVYYFTKEEMIVGSYSEEEMEEAIDDMKKYIGIQIEPIEELVFDASIILTLAKEKFENLQDFLTHLVNKG